MDQILILTNVPEQALASQLATCLVEQGLAACVHILAPVTSVYRWQGKIESAQEIPLVIKTSQSRYMEVEAAICKLHPYELPEILHVPLAGGLPAYLAWISQETL